MSLEEAQQAVYEDMRAAFVAAAPDVIYVSYPDGEFGEAVDCGGGQWYSTVQIGGNNLDDELSNDHLLDKATEHLQRLGWMITPEYTDSSDRSALASKDGVADGRVYASGQSLTFTGETYCDGRETPEPKDPLAVADSIEAAQQDTSAEIRGAIAAAVPGVIFEEDEFGEPVQCLRTAHRTTIRIAGSAPEGTFSDEELMARAGEYLEARDWVIVPQHTWDRRPALGTAKRAVGNGVLEPQERGLIFDGGTPCVQD